MTDDDTEQSRLDDRERIIIAGSRSIDDRQLLRHIMITDWAPPEIAVNAYEIVTGGADGVDELGKQYAEKWDIPHTEFTANWDVHGDAAGPMRNRSMAEYADTLIALWDGESSGTESMIEIALEQGLEVHVYQPHHLQ